MTEAQDSTKNAAVKTVDVRAIQDSPSTQVLELLSAGGDGLSNAEAARRLEQYGPNAIEEKRGHPLRKFLSYFWGPIPWMIEIAAGLAALVRDWAEFSIILTLLLVNAVIGFWEENKADNAIALLKQRLALMAQVLRDGLGRIGVNIVSRLMGLLLVAVGVEFIARGPSALFPAALGGSP